MREIFNNLCFVDTNIWLYAFIKSQNESKHNISKKIIKECEIVISIQVVNEVCLNLIKKLNFSEANIVDLINSFYAKYLIVEIDKYILLDASKLRKTYNISFWDSIIVSTALEADAKFLITEDMQDGLTVWNKLTIINPYKNDKIMS